MLKIVRSKMGEAFSAEVRCSLVSDVGPLTFFIAAYPSVFGDTASPIFYLSYIQITNLQDVPSTISNFKVAVSKERDGPREDLIAIPLYHSTIYALGISLEAKADGEDLHQEVV